jgi:hypothetical protein
MVMELLEWCGRNPGLAFVLGIFLVTALAILCNFIIRLPRSFTGKYPPPAPVVDCPCRERCSYHEDEDEEDEDA